MASLEDEIANAIRKADNSYFMENYNKQAAAVLKHLSKLGYKIVPNKASDEMIESGKNAVTSGRVKPSDFVRMIYETMVASVKL